MITPPPFFAIQRAASCPARNGPVRFTFSTPSHASYGSSRMSCGFSKPALLTQT